MNIEIKGTVTAVTEDKKGTPVFAVKLGERTHNGKVYEDVVAVRAWNKNIRVQASELQPGVTVKVSADVKSREWNGAWFTDVDAFRIEVTSGAKSAGTHRKVNAKAPSEDADDSDNVPF